jgi:predicted exporter
MVPVVFGAIFGLAVTALIQGSVSVIALGAGAIILGIAIDFSVHFMSHARTHPDMRENVRTLVFPLTLGGLTTVGAFLALRWFVCCSEPYWCFFVYIDFSTAFVAGKKGRAEVS